MDLIAEVVFWRFPGAVKTAVRVFCMVLRCGVGDGMVLVKGPAWYTQAINVYSNQMVRERQELMAQLEEQGMAHAGMQGV